MFLGLFRQMLVKNKTNLLLVNVQEVQLLDNSIPFTVVPSYCYVITPCHHFDVSIWSKSHVLIGYWSKKDPSCLLKIAYFYPVQEKITFWMDKIHIFFQVCGQRSGQNGQKTAKTKETRTTLLAILCSFPALQRNSHSWRWTRQNLSALQ